MGVGVGVAGMTRGDKAEWRRRRRGWLQQEGQEGARRGRLVVAIGVLAVAGYIMFTQLLSDFIQQRFGLLFAADQGDSIDARRYILDIASTETASHPFGVGWGGLEPSLAPSAQYPHNVVAEVFAEAGWIAGAAFLVYIAAALVRARRDVLVLPLLTYWLLNALVSGDVNDNRALFAFLGVAIALGGVAVTRADREGAQGSVRDLERASAAPSHA